MTTKRAVKQVVCVRYRTWETEAFRVSVGRPGYTDPKTGKRFEDDEYQTWTTAQSCCESCGEMLGTYRARYRRRRFHATVSGHKCEDCGCGVCDACVVWQRTDEMIGTHKRTTEGGARYDVPTYRSRALCVPCYKRRKAQPTEPPKPTAEDILKALGLA